jgi:hypothetical protein
MLHTVVNLRIEALAAYIAHHPFSADTPEGSAVRQADARYLNDLRNLAAKLDV